MSDISIIKGVKAYLDFAAERNFEREDIVIGLTGMLAFATPVILKDVTPGTDLYNSGVATLQRLIGILAPVNVSDENPDFITNCPTIQREIGRGSVQTLVNETVSVSAEYDSAGNRLGTFAEMEKQVDENWLSQDESDDDKAVDEDEVDIFLNKATVVESS